MSRFHSTSKFAVSTLKWPLVWLTWGYNPITPILYLNASREAMNSASKHKTAELQLLASLILMLGTSVPVLCACFILPRLSCLKLFLKLAVTCKSWHKQKCVLKFRHFWNDTLKCFSQKCITALHIINGKFYEAKFSYNMFVSFT